MALFHWFGSLSDKLTILMLEDVKLMDDFLAKSRTKLAEIKLLVRKVFEDAGIK